MHMSPAFCEQPRQFACISFILCSLKITSREFPSEENFIIPKSYHNCTSISGSFYIRVHLWQLHRLGRGVNYDTVVGLHVFPWHTEEEWMTFTGSACVTCAAAIRDQYWRLGCYFNSMHFNPDARRLAVLTL